LNGEKKWGLYCDVIKVSTRLKLCPRFVNLLECQGELSVGNVLTAAGGEIENRESGESWIKPCSLKGTSIREGGGPTPGGRDELRAFRALKWRRKKKHTAASRKKEPARLGSKGGVEGAMKYLVWAARNCEPPLDERG